MEEGRPLTVPLSPVHMLALAASGVALGEWIRRRAPLIERLRIPGSIAGGLALALISLALHARGVEVKADGSTRDILQLICFTVIGLNASLGVAARGGVQVFRLLGLASAGAVLQNALGVGLASVFGLHPLAGILSGAVSLAGGPATSAAFGATFEKAGVAGATSIALASATFGIAVSGLMAGFAGARLIAAGHLTGAPGAESRGRRKDGGAGALAHAILIAVSMGVGSLVSAAIERTGVVLPGYIGAMVAAAAIRNLDDATGVVGISESRLMGIFGVFLPLFIVMAMLTLKLWELAALAGPLLAILLAQTVLVWLLSVTLVWRVMGRNYDAAVESAGFCGFMLGVTANAIASMEELTNRHGASAEALLIVPLVGAFLIDFTNALIITGTVNLLK